MLSKEVKKIADTNNCMSRLMKSTSEVIIFTGFENAPSNYAPYNKQKEMELMQVLENATTRTFTQWGYKAHQIRVKVEGAN